MVTALSSIAPSVRIHFTSTKLEKIAMPEHGHYGQRTVILPLRD